MEIQAQLENGTDEILVEECCCLTRGIQFLFE
jgi:hypothetical protein